MAKKNIFYAQSGGVTAVINATACGVVETARRHHDRVGTVYAGRNGILGALFEDLIDCNQESANTIAALRHTPGGAFGSSRYKLNPPDQDPTVYQRLLEVFRAHDIGYFFYNGGNDSQDTTHKIAAYSRSMGYPLVCLGLPKTIDNDLAHTDNSPGFGSVAKYVATSTRECALDVASMYSTSTRVFVLEVMGRHAGWIAASSGLAAHRPQDAPHVILFPEVPWDEARFLARVAEVVDNNGHCVVVASEGVQDASGRFLAEAGARDTFGHAQLGGVAPFLGRLIKEKLGHKQHWAVADYLQRSARHLASKTDVEQAYALGCAAVEHALAGADGVMLTIERQGHRPYRWCVGTVGLAEVAGRERKLPPEYIAPDGYGITDACRDYLAPLIEGEDYPPYAAGLPVYAQLASAPIARRTPPWQP